MAQQQPQPKPRPSSAHPQARRKKKKKKNYLPTLALIGFLVAIALVVLQFLDNKPVAEKDNAPLTAPTYRATLTAVGDINMSDELVADALQPDGTYDFAPGFFGVASLLHGADLTIGNLELSFSGEPYAGATSSAPESLAVTLRSLGFDILQTANSKTLAGGIKGLRSTLETVRAHNIEPLGSYASQSERKASGGVLVQEVNGIRIAFIALTKGFDGMAIPTGNEYCADVLYTDYDSVYSKINRDQILSLVANAKAEKPDVIIAMVHWGSEYRMTISKTQDQIADLLFQNGVDVILGSHSHMAGPMEFREIELDDGTEKEVFIAYSLGNFYASDSTAYAQESVILNMEFTKDPSSGVTKITSADYTPIYLLDNGEGAPNRYQTQTIDLALSLYDQSYITRVSETMQEKLVSAVDTLKENTAPVEDEEEEKK